MRECHSPAVSNSAPSRQTAEEFLHLQSSVSGCQSRMTPLKQPKDAPGVTRIFDVLTSLCRPE